MDRSFCVDVFNRLPGSVLHGVEKVLKDFHAGADDDDRRDF